MDDTDDRRMGGNIRRLRTARGLTQEQLAARLHLRGCGLTRSGLAKIEAGQRHIYAYEIRLFRELLETSFEELFR